MRQRELNYTYGVEESNVPPSEVITQSVEYNDKYWYHCLGRKVYRFANGCRKNPVLMEAIRAKAAQLEAEGFFEKYPPKPRHQGEEIF